MSAPSQDSQFPPRIRDFSLRNLALISLLTAFAFFIMGYHPGLEDDVFYLAAIKRNLNPTLFSHDADFFRIQFQATIFDKLIALSVRLTHLPLAWAVLLWQLAAIFFILHGCFRIARRCFPDPAAHWAAVTLIAALLTIPVSGSAINLVDQYLHPRALATAFILAAIVAVLDRRPLLTGLLLAIAFSIHAIMAAFGISFCAFLWWTLRQTDAKPSRLPNSVKFSSALTPCPLWCKPFTAAKSAALFVVTLPLGWIFEPANDAWRKAASTRGFYYLSHWEWYEWLGVFAPLALLFAYQRFLNRAPTGKGTTSVVPVDQQKDNRALAPEGSSLQPLVSALLYYGIFQTIAALVIMLPPRLERFRPLEPMRYLHILYLFFFLLVGAVLGRYVLRAHAYRWAILFLPLAAGMFYSQRQLYPASAHIEWPGAAPRSQWVQAFNWIRTNTPVDVLFALGPHYMLEPEEDFHGFRALAERSSLADYDKDGGMAARVPSLAPRWLTEVNAQQGWQNFQPQDFARLKNDFGVAWIVLSPRDAGFASAKTDSNSAMTCPYKKEVVVCRLY